MDFMYYQFDWDVKKAETNLKKHEVSFDEAKTVFLDDYARTFKDVEHSVGEIRELIIGYSNNNRLLIVIFTQRDDLIRIISARKVTKNERKLYEDFQKF